MINNKKLLPAPITEEFFYLRDSRSNTGSSAVFWSAAGGYTTDLNKAEKFTRENAERQYRSRETDIPLRCDLIDVHAYLAVDCQLVKCEGMEAQNGEYVVQLKQAWDGNNIKFLCATGGYSYDYSKAKTTDAHINTTGAYLLPKSEIDKIARPVIDVANINEHLLLRKAKIKMEPRRRARPTTGKHRGNCPECGKIVWDFNPYEAAYCIEHRI